MKKTNKQNIYGSGSATLDYIIDVSVEAVFMTAFCIIKYAIIITYKLIELIVKLIIKSIIQLYRSSKNLKQEVSYSPSTVDVETVETKEQETSKETRKKTIEGTFYNMYQDMIEQPHLLIAGATGSGKSVLINGLMYTIMGLKNDSKMILIDPKGVELSQYKSTSFCIKHATEHNDMIQALQLASDIVDQRFIEMQKTNCKKKTNEAVYVVIDELADLMLTGKKQVQPLLQHICQVGRAANVHVIAATQCPLREVIPTSIKVNFDSRVGLRTRSAQDSRNILGSNGLEKLPQYGECIYMTSDRNEKLNVPMYSDEQLQEVCDFYSSKSLLSALIGR